MSTVQLRDLGKVYPSGHRAVNSVDLDIDDGEFFVLLGPSGCGKTSLLRMIAGLEAITVGDVFVDGTSVAGVGTNLRNLAMLFQAPTLYPYLTVAENIGFPLRLARMHRRDRAVAVREVAELLGVVDLLDRLPGQLSGGQQQRVAMGRALVRHPTLMLMDEPMSNLDAKFRTELRADLVSMQRRVGVTTIYVTHDQVEAMAMGDRIAVMNSGDIVQCGTPADLYDEPVDIFVAQFVGASPMNLFGVEVTVVEGEAVVGAGTWDLVLQRDATGDLAFSTERTNDRVIVGVRPESFIRHDDGPFVMDVNEVEWQGSHAVARGVLSVARAGGDDRPAAISTIAGADVSVLLEGSDAITRFQPLRLDIDRTRIHLFDESTGRSLVANSTT